MGPSLWSRDQTRVHAMETQGVPEFQDVSCVTISRRDHGTAFWDSEGDLLLEFMPHKTTITVGTYAFTMEALRWNFKQKRRGKLSGGVLLLHEYAPAHKSRKSRGAIRKCGFVELNRPPYSPDLAPSDYSLFRNLKKFLCGRRFPDDNAVKEAVTGYFDTQEVLFFLRVFDHWRRSGLSELQSRGTTLKNNEASFIIRFNFHAQVDNLLNAPHIGYS